MDPKEITPEDGKSPVWVPDLSELFAKVDPAPLSQDQSLSQDSITSVPSPAESVLFSESTKPSVDPKLLASNLEDKWSDDTLPASQQLLEQQVQQSSQLLSPQPKVEVVEKIVYKKQRVHGFFRTLALVALLFVGVLMLLEWLKIFSLDLDWLDTKIFYPVFIILNVIVIWSYKGLFGKIMWSLMFLGVVAGFFVISVYSSLSSTIENHTGSLLTFPIYSGTHYSKIYVSTILNSLTVGAQTGSGLLVSNYDVERPLSLLSGYVLWSHNYAIITESDKVNLLEWVYTRLQLGLQEQHPIYLYIKTLLGQNTLDMTNVLTRWLRMHWGIVSTDIIFWSGQILALSPTNTLSDLSGSSIQTWDIALWTGTESSLLTGSVLSWAVSSWFITSISSWSNHIDLDVQAAIADITLHLPKTMWVRMQYKSYIWTVDLPQITKKIDGIYESDNIDKATTILDINALFGLSRLTIVRDR